jgi:spore germination protein GerM
VQDRKMWLVAAISGLVLVWLGSACNSSVVEPGGAAAGPSGTITLALYFGNTEMNPGLLDCSKVYAVERVVPVAPDMAEAAILQLFAGPTEKEIAEGYVSTFSEATRSILKSVKIEEGTAYVNLVDVRPILTSVSSSCGSSAFFAEVENTLRGVAPVKRVIFAIDSEPAAFYEWVQLGCSADNDYCDSSPFVGDED